MVLVGDGVIVLASTGLAPISLCKLQGVVDLSVEGAVPLCCLLVEQHGEHARLNAQLNERTTVVGVAVARGGEDTLLALVAASGASGDVAEFWPGEVIGEHDGCYWGVG